jgi:hypothetical protein
MLKTWDFEDEYYNHWWCTAQNKREAYKEARKILEKNRQYNSGKQVIGLRRNLKDELEEMIARSEAD